MKIKKVGSEYWGDITDIACDIFGKQIIESARILLYDDCGADNGKEYAVNRAESIEKQFKKTKALVYDTCDILLTFKTGVAVRMRSSEDAAISSV